MSDRPSHAVNAEWNKRIVSFDCLHSRAHDWQILCCDKSIGRRTLSFSIERSYVCSNIISSAYNRPEFFWRVPELSHSFVKILKWSEITRNFRESRMFRSVDRILSDVRNLHESEVPPLFSYIQRGVADVADETRMLPFLAGLSGRMAGFATLYAEVSIRYIFGWYRLLISFHGLSLLLDLEVSQDWDEQEKDDESHTAADYETESSREKTADTTHVSHRGTIAAYHCVLCLQSLHFGATTRRWILHLCYWCWFDQFVLRNIQMAHKHLLVEIRQPGA